MSSAVAVSAGMMSNPRMLKRVPTKRGFSNDVCGTHFLIVFEGIQTDLLLQ